MVMPVIGGRELAERLQPIRPEMKVIYMSGYTDEAIGRKGILSSEANFIQKPFKQEQLEKKVPEVLDK
jgi:FixJ family two-component response regulator